MNLLLDTNVIIDYLGRQQPFYEDAERIIAIGYFGDASLWAPAQSFKDAFYVLSHYADPVRVQGAILALIDVVKPIGLTGDDLAAAAKMKWNDLEDCLVAIGAGKAHADYLVTRDRKGFARSSTPAISPAELLERIRETDGISYGAVEFEGNR